MQTVGSFLKSGRIKARLTLTQVSRLTNISVAALTALEKNRFSLLPGETYVQGFVQNYAQVVKFDPKQAVAIFKRDFNRRRVKQIVPQGLVKPLNPVINYQRLWFFAVMATVLVYLGVTIFNLFQPPELIIRQPREGEEVSVPIVIKGKTDRDATLTLNNQTVNLEPDGSFTTVQKEAELRFKTTSRRGKVREIVRHVIIVP